MRRYVKKNLYNVATSLLIIPRTGHKVFACLNRVCPYKGGADKDLFSHISASSMQNISEIYLPFVDSVY